MISGDFNDHAELWSKLDKDKNKHSKLAESIIKSKLVVLNDGRATRYPDRVSQTASAIDLTFVSPNIGSADWACLTSYLHLSDHCPQIGSISLNGNHQPPEKQKAYVYDKANWQKFTESLNKDSANDPGSNNNWEGLSVEDHFKKFHKNVNFG